MSAESDETDIIVYHQRGHGTHLNRPGTSGQNEPGIQECVCVVLLLMSDFSVSSEGKMVVLSLAIGLAEQDDFANLPDLQEAPANKENESSSEKR